jgi:hypothetical protein
MRLPIAFTFHVYFLLSPAAKKPELVRPELTSGGASKIDSRLFFQ